MIKGYLQNDRGDTPMFEVFLTLVLMILLSFLLLFSTVQLRTLDLRNGIKMELNNLSARIYADTYQSQREANLPAYENRVQSSSAYLAGLENTFRTGLRKKLPLETEDYRLSDVKLEFEDTGDEIKYTFRCHAEYFVTMFGQRFTPFSNEIELTGRHRTKY